MKAKLYKNSTDIKAFATVTAKAGVTIDEFKKQLFSFCIPGTCFVCGKLELTYRGIVGTYSNLSGYVENWERISLR